MKLSYEPPAVITQVEGVECSGLRVKGGGLGIVRCSGSVAGVFTTNTFKAAPVIVTEEHLKDGHIEGIIANSGNANAYTGTQGIKNAETMAEILAEKLGCEAKDVAVASTGVIGVQLDMGWIEEMFGKVYPELGGEEENSWKFAKAITTTDSFTKQWGLKIGDAVVAGVAKGAGMIAPKMATMLAFVFTDAKVEEMDSILKKAVSKTFNSLVVDGDTSTNDMVLLISTGKKRCDSGRVEKAVTHVCSTLAEMIAADGEGATKLMRVFVKGAKSVEDAEKAARAVASSILVKTALFGCDANWGRIVAAVGYSGAEVGELSLEVVGKKWNAWESFGRSEIEGNFDVEANKARVKLLERGKDTGKRSEARKLMRENEVVEFHIDLGMGSESYCVVGCDLSYDYVKLNSEYTT